MLRRQFPNLITLCNLLCGVIATYVALVGSLRLAALFICLGIVFDFFDGMAARLLRVSSLMGKELDSLADVVTSGVAPCMIQLALLQAAGAGRLSAIAFLTPLFAAYRLAKFNLDTRQGHSFLGLPVPSNALVWVGLALTVMFPLEGKAAIIVMIVLALVGDILMVSELPLFSLKFDFKNLAWRSNRVQYVFLIVCAVLIIAMRDWLAISAIIVWYIILSAATKRLSPDA